jgi:AcrR family transcriptional regulator
VPGVAAVDRPSSSFDGASFADATRSLLRRTLLQAARDLAADGPWKQVTMAAIARRAGVSRQTVYNEFGSRPNLTRALVVQELEQFLAAVEDAIRARPGDPGAAIGAALEVFLQAAAEDPLVAAVVGEDGRDELLPLVTSRGQPLLRYGGERLTALLRETWPAFPEDEAGFVAETIMRLGLSYVVMPVTDGARTAAGVAQLLRPHLESRVGAVRTPSVPTGTDGPVGASSV